MPYSVDDAFRDEALGHLRKLTGDQASGFREQQLEVIHRLVEERQRVLLVERTGWGKSAVYFIATRMLRDRGAGPTLLISPLLALMRNQIEAAVPMGVRAVTINSENRDEWGDIIASLGADEPPGPTPDASAPLEGMTVVVTGALDGYSRAAAREAVVDRGGRSTEDVSVKTNVLVAGKRAGSKLAKAEALGVPVIDEAAFDRLLATGELPGKRAKPPKPPTLRGPVDLLLISPERLANQGFRTDVLPEVGRRSGLLVIDEVHCVSDWGHDFRPNYRRIARVLALLPDGVPIIGCTATANDRVIDDVDAQLATDVSVRGPLGREGLRLHVLDLPRPAERLVWLSETIPKLGGTGIVYTLTIADAERVAEWLRTQGLDALAYHGSLEPERRIVVEQRLLANEVDVVVATSALGMGFDKRDLRFVVHYQAPAYPISYYQQVGRAGRQLDESWGVLLRGAEDEDIQDFFIENAFPPPDLAEAVVSFLEESGESFTVPNLEQTFNARRTRLNHLLTTLEVEGAVERDGYRWRRTLAPWSYDFERAEQVTALRRIEQGQMLEYAATHGCRMVYLRNLLDDPVDVPCGICDRCAEESLAIALDPFDPLIAAAVEHLRRGYLRIEPRRQWPTGGRIPQDRRNEVGRALSRWGDGGWGDRVAENRLAGQFDEDTLDRAVELVQTQWNPEPFPTWVTVLPSVRFPGLTADFAARLAERLGIGFSEVVERVADREPQRNMHNSAMQFRNVDQAFTVRGPVDEGPVLLLDDVVDSRWTMTVVGSALREAGSGPVLPFALADSAGRST